MDSISGSKFARLFWPWEMRMRMKRTTKSGQKCIDFVARGMLYPPVIYVNDSTEQALDPGGSSHQYIV